MTADERITALADPDSIAQIPSFLRKHAFECSCKLIAREHPDIYEAFSSDAEPDNGSKSQMKALIDDIIAKRLEKYACKGENT